MTREERLQQIAKDLAVAKDSEKIIKGSTSELRDEFFRLHDLKFKGKDHLLPIRTIEVPQSFFNVTGLSKEDFVTTRFPGWEVEHVELNTATGLNVFVLKRSPKYMPGVVEVKHNGGTIRVSKEVSEYTPEIDWETLQQERPDLYQRISKPVQTVEIDEEEFQKLVEEVPEELATIQRHMKVKEPTLRATARKVKNEEDERADN